MRDLALTFAGGGNRSFYQFGLMKRWSAALLPRVGAVATTSAGACVALLMLTDRFDDAHERWLARCRGLEKNIDWSKLLYGERPAPHGEILRDVFLHAFRDGAVERVRAQPFPIFVVSAAMPSKLPTAAAAAIALGAYSLEKTLRRRMIHPAFGRWLGFMPHVVDARDCESGEELCDLVLASAATPPFTPVGRFRGTALLDGGFVDNVPAFACDAVEGIRKNIVLLSRPYPLEVLGAKGSRLYIAPTERPPLDRWDYTRPELLREVIAFGEREAQHHQSSLESFLS